MVVKVDYYTKSRDHTDVNVHRAHRQMTNRFGFALRFGQCSVHVQWYVAHHSSVKSCTRATLHEWC